MNTITSLFGAASAPEQCKPCCQKKLQAQVELLHMIDAVCRIALAAFAIYLDATVFAYTFTVGALTSLSLTWYSLSVHEKSQSDGALKPFCGQGYMEFMSGKIFPTWATHLVTTAFIGAHMRHDPQFFVPFSGLFLGWGAGCALAEGAWKLSQKVVTQQQTI